jgi:hypothetical protein
MCPVCLAAAALVAVKATSSGGFAALVINKVRAKNAAHEFPTQPGMKEDHHVEYDNFEHDDCN